MATGKEVKKLTTKALLAAHFVALGYTSKKIAEETGYHVRYVEQLRGNPLFNQ